LFLTPLYTVVWINMWTSVSLLHSIFLTGMGGWVYASAMHRHMWLYAVFIS